MRWSWRLGSLFGIDIYLHWTFLILIAWIIGLHVMRGEGILVALAGVGFVAAIFGCIVLHELGHALAARRYGVPTRDITLLPIGGVARLQRMPEHPLQEFVVAVAGPLVNVVIALILLAILWPSGQLAGLSTDVLLADGNFLLRLMIVNVILVAFNLLPAFPMDGGRMLRALLATSMEYTRATNIAAWIGQLMAIAFAVAGLLIPNFFLLFIALFVYLGAEGEARLVQIRILLRGVPVRDAMMTRFRALAPQDTLQTAADELLAGVQQDFPVVDDQQQFLGILRRGDLAQGLRDKGPQHPVGELIVPCAAVAERDMLESAMQQLQGAGCSMLPVLRDGQLIGLLTLENIGELMMIQKALRGRPTPDDWVRAA